MTWPTLRLLKSLKSGWTDKAHEALVAQEAWSQLPAFTELVHPAVQICQDFETQPSSDRYEAHQSSSNAAGYAVIEAKDKSRGAGWRTAIIRKSGTVWAVFADGHDKFHSSAANAFGSKRRAGIEPTVKDEAIRKLKIGENEQYLLIADWQRQLVRSVLGLFKDVYLNNHDGQEVCVALPEPPKRFLQDPTSSLDVTVRLSILRNDRTGTFDNAHEEQAEYVELLIDFTPWKATSDIVALLQDTILPVIDPREERWTRNSASYSKAGDLSFSYDMSVARASQIIYAAESEDPQDHEPGEPQKTGSSHYVAASEITASVVDGRPMRSACGFWFVSSRLPDDLPICPACIEDLPDASAVHTMLRQRIPGRS